MLAIPELDRITSGFPAREPSSRLLGRGPGGELLQEPGCLGGRAAGLLSTLCLLPETLARGSQSEALTNGVYTHR